MVLMVDGNAEVSFCTLKEEPYGHASKYRFGGYFMGAFVAMRRLRQ
jgi:hypothetical protein